MDYARAGTSVHMPTILAQQKRADCLGGKLGNEATTQGREDALEESRAHKGAMESRYDTFKEEAQYLANAQEGILAELTGAAVLLKSLRDNPPRGITQGCLYAIVEAEDLEDGSTAKYFLLPAGGGNTYEIDGEKITALNVMAPSRVLS